MLTKNSFVPFSWITKERCKKLQMLRCVCVPKSAHVLANPAVFAQACILINFASSRGNVYKFNKNRVVTDEQKTALKAKLPNFFASYRNKNMKHIFHPNVLLEFGKFHISQILQNCHLLLSVNDICNCIEIWRMEHTFNISYIVDDIFKDIQLMQVNWNLEILTRKVIMRWVVVTGQMLNMTLWSVCQAK